jgi:hypothetical protein
MQVAVVLSQYRHIYNRAAGEVGIFESKRDNQFLHSAPYTFAPFRKRSNQSSFVEAIAVGCRCSKRVSQTRHVGT